MRPTRRKSLKSESILFTATSARQIITITVIWLTVYAALRMAERYASIEITSGVGEAEDQ